MATEVVAAVVVAGEGRAGEGEEGERSKGGRAEGEGGGGERVLHRRLQRVDEGGCAGPGCFPEGSQSHGLHSPVICVPRSELPARPSRHSTFLLWPHCQ